MSFFKGIQTKVSGTLNQGNSSANQKDQQHDDRSLTTLLDCQERAELSILISQITETMRNEVIRCFDETPPPRLPPRPEKDTTQEETDEAGDLSKIAISNTGAGDGKIESPLQLPQQTENPTPATSNVIKREPSPWNKLPKRKPFEPPPSPSSMPGLNQSSFV